LASALEFLPLQTDVKRLPIRMATEDKLANPVANHFLRMLEDELAITRSEQQAKPANPSFMFGVNRVENAIQDLSCNNAALVLRQDLPSSSLPLNLRRETISPKLSPLRAVHKNSHQFAFCRDADVGHKRHLDPWLGKGETVPLTIIARSCSARCSAARPMTRTSPRLSPTN
jgi:hypothetical protein